MGVLGWLEAAGAFIARWRADERRRRAELYDRRIPVFNAIRDYMWLVASANTQREAEQTFLQSTEHVSFLFGGDIRRFVDEVFDKSGKLHSLRTMESSLSDKGLEENLDRQDAIMQWFKKEAKSIDHRCERYLNL